MLLLKKNIVILGMTGVGKTTIGRILSKKLKKKFIDSDQEIEIASGMRIADFFSKFSEKEFRVLEKKIIIKIISENNGIVISTGAGALSEKKINNFIFSKTISIFLKAKKETIIERLKDNYKNRPKLSIGNLEENIEEMYNKRIINYNQALIKINVDNLSIQDVITEIIKNLDNYAKN